MGHETPYTAPTAELQREGARTLVDSQTACLFAASFACVLTMLFQLSETTPRGGGLRSRFGLPTFFIMDHAPSPIATNVRPWQAGVNLAIASVIAMAMIPAANSSRWFLRHKLATVTLALLAMILGFKDWIIDSDIPWFIDAAMFMSLLCLPWFIAHRSDSYRLSLLIPFLTTIAWGTFSRAAELHMGVYDNQAVLSVLQRSALALALSGLSCSSIFLHRRRLQMQNPGT